MGALALDVREDALTFEGEAVYLHETSRDNLAFLMFRDGVRTLSLHPGCEIGESEALVDCLAHAEDLANMEQDLVTALWERDLSHIDYQVVDPFLGSALLREGMVDALRETVLRRLETVQAPGLSPGDMARVEIRAGEAEADTREGVSDSRRKRSNAANERRGPVLGRPGLR